MKQKIGTLIDEEVLRLAKRLAIDQGRPLNELIQDALVSYLTRDLSDPREREAGYVVFCERPIRLSSTQFQQVLQEDPWES